MSPAKDKEAEDDETTGGGEEDYADAVTRHAKYLGIDPERDAAYLWIAEEALNADVPEGWVTGEGEGEYEGLVYYYNEASGESTWDHPLDEYYREKFKKKKAKHADRKRRDGCDKHASRSGSASSRFRTSCSTNRHNTSDIDKERDDRSNSERKSSKRSTRREKHGSSDRLDGREYDSQGSRNRSASGSRHHGSRRERRTAGDDEEGSRHRSRSRQHGRGDDSRHDADEHDSSTRSRSRSDRHRRDGDGDQAHGVDEKYGYRRKEGGQRSKGYNPDDKGTMERRRSRSTNETRSSGRRGKGRNSRPTPTSEDREAPLRSSRASNDSEGNVDGGIEKRKGVEGEARGQPDAASNVRQDHVGELDRESNTKGRKKNSLPGHEDVGSYPSSRLVLEEGRRSRSREMGHRAGFAPDRIRESSDADRKDRRRGSGLEALSQRQDDENRQATASVTRSQDPSAAGDTWRTKSINGNLRGERAESFNAKQTISTNPDFDTSTNVEGDRTKGRTSGIDDHGRGQSRTETTAEPRVYIVKLEETPGKNGPSGDSTILGQATHGAAQNSEKTRVKRTATTSWNDNDLEEMDFEDELRDIEDNSDKNSLADRKAEPSTTLAAPGTSTNVSSESKLPEDIERSDEPGATASSALPMSTVTAKADVQRRPDRDEYPDGTGPPKGSSPARTVTPSRKIIEDETRFRHRRSSGAAGEIRRVDSQISELVTSAFGISNRDEDEWPEVTEDLVDGLEGREKNPASDRQRSEDVRRGRGESGGRGREGGVDADVVSGDDAEHQGYHGNTNDNKWGAKERDRSRERKADRNSDLLAPRLQHHEESDWDSPKVLPDRHHTGANDVRFDESATRVRASGGHGTSGASGNPSGDENSAIYRSGRGRNFRNDGSRGDGHNRSNVHQQHGWSGEESFAVGQRAGRNDRHQYSAGGGVDHWEVERQLPQQQQEAAANRRDLESKLVRLEVSLAASTSREDHLRGELVDTARREGAAQEKHSRALAEEEKRMATLNDELAKAVSKAEEAAKAEETRCKDEERLRLELTNVQERLAAAEVVLAQKEEEKASAAGEISAPNLRLMLATREEEAERQGKMLVDVQGRLAEATNKATEMSREVHRSKDLTERLRLEATESSSRASTSEAALSQAASEMSALNHALSRAREETSSKESEVAKAVEETNRLRLQLGLEQEKSSNAEDRLLRVKAGFESEAESLRARTAELQSANASMEREMRNSQQDSLSRLRELERERDAALYEGKRSGELASSAEAWRLKETLRADAAETKALTTGTEVAELRSEAARLRTGTDAALAPYIKRNAELQGMLDEARREAAGLAAEGTRLKATHASEMAAVKEEVSRQLPLIAEKAASEAGRHWRKRAEQETTAVRSERDSRLRELQAAVSEGEARRQNFLAGARFDAERFRGIAEKLAAENRSIRGELERHLAGGARPLASGSRNSSTCGHRAGVAGRSSSKAFADGDGTAGGRGQRGFTNGKGWEGVLQAQVLEEVEAHLNVLRAQLKRGTPDMKSAADSSGYEHDAEAVDSCQTGSPLRSGDPIAVAAAGVAVADIENAVKIATAGAAPASVENRGTYHLSTTPEQRSGNGLTEMEDMRLTRLLRSSASSSLPASVLSLVECISPMSGKRRAKCIGGNGTVVRPGGTNADNNNSGNLGEGTIERSDYVFPDGDGGTGNRFFPEDPLRGSGGVARKLFGDGLEGGSEDLGIDGPGRRVSEARAGGKYTTTRGVGPLAGEDEDDLEDISDGGFHSGCWRRKYVHGDMR